MDGGKSWNTIRRENPINENNLALYERLMDAAQRLDGMRRRRGLSESAFADAIAVAPSDPRVERDDDLLALGRYVAALGGQLELRAVFPDETVTLLREPEDRV